jgi:asparagine synthase (glutamine-hydrolysing)
VQGIEARVPYLDRRLVECLARVPPALHEHLFWDKRIVRDAAARWLPPELIGRPKVGFYRATDMSSIESLKRRMVLRIFPAFADKYLHRMPGTNEREDVRREAEAIAAAHGDVRREVSALLRLMSLLVFEDQCEHGVTESVRLSLQPPSPLTEHRSGAPSQPLRPAHAGR